MRPRLRADVRYAKTPDGVHVRGSAGACTLTGDTGYEWLDRLAPFLTGEHALSDLVEPLPSDQRAVVEHLVRALFEQRLLVDAADDPPHTLSDEELRVYQPEIASIRSGADSAEHRFERLRSARVTVLGGGPVLPALLAAGLRSGWRRVSVRTDEGDVDGLTAVARDAVRDSAQHVAVDVARGLPLDDTDLLLCVSDRPDDLVAAAHACGRAGVAVGQVLLGGDEAWVTAVGPPERVAAESCWRRLGAGRGGEAGESCRHRLGEWRGGEAGQGVLTDPWPGVVASHLVLSCFSYLTGSAPEVAEPVLTRVDLRDLTTRVHRPRPYLVTGDVRPDAVADVAGFPERIRRFVDDRVGVLRRLDEDDLPQVPLAVCRASVSDPESVLPARAPAPVVTGWGGDRDEARWRAALAGLATYGSLVDPGGERVDLLTGGACEIGACEISAVEGRVPYRAPVGVAAGRSWGDAVAAGLRAHCEVLVAERAETARRCELATAVREVGDERALRLLRFFETAGVEVGATDLGGVLGVPAFRLLVGGTAITSCATTVAEALRDGLERAVLHWQCGLPEDAAVTRWAAEGDHPPPAPADDPRCQALFAALRRAGRAPAAVALLVDDDVRALVPCLVRVVDDD